MARDEKMMRKRAQSGYYVVSDAEGWDMLNIHSGPHSREEAVKARDNGPDDAWIKTIR